MTGENFIGMNRKSKKSELQDKLNELLNERAELQNINRINEYGFDSIKDDKLTQRIERLEYLIYCVGYEDNRRRNWN